MRWWRWIGGTIRSLFRKAELDRELDAELRVYLDLLTEEKIKAGLTPQQARRQARLELGGMEQVKIKVREVRFGTTLETVWQDVRYGLRMLRKNSGFTAVAVLTLALGIGANTAIFSVVNGVLLRPLPYPDPDRIVMVYETYRPRFDRSTTSPGNFHDWQEKNEVFEHMAAINYTSYTLTGNGEPERVPTARVSPAFFPLMGVRPVLGRGLLPEEDSPGREQVVVLGYGLWQRRFGGRPGLLGETITLDGKPYTVVGVMPASFQYPRDAQAWVPLVLPPDQKNSRRSWFLRAIARLEPGLRLEQAQAGMDTLARQLEQQYPKSNKNRGVNLVPLHEAHVYRVRSILWMLQGVVGFVLLIACANMANLLLVRAAAREKEMAIRAAIGAGRARLVRQLLTESVLLAATGGALGLLLAWGGVKMFIAFSPPYFPRLDAVRLDGQVLAFTLGLSVLTGIMFGLAPALRSSAPDLNQALKEGLRTGGTGSGLLRQHRLRNLLVVGEVALALVLLVGAGLLIRSFLLLTGQDTGFKPEKLLTMVLSLPQYKYPDQPQQRQFFQQLVERTKLLPEVRSAAAINALPFSDWMWQWSFQLEEGAVPETKGSASYQIATPGYFRSLGIPLVRGRTFTEQDTEAADGVVVVNQAFAQRYFPQGDPLGQRIVIHARPARWNTIVGVVGDIRHSGLHEEPKPEMYRPFAQAPGATMMLVVRTDGNPLRLAAALRSQVNTLDPDQPIGKISTMAGLISDSVAQPRFYTLLLSLFAGLAAVLAAVGIYGVISYSVSQRTHEIGIRMALGAQRADILKMMVGRGLLLTLLGVALGLGGAFAATRVLSSLLFGVTPTDPATFAAVAAVLAAVALLACYLPARRATKVDPMVALRYE